MYNFYLPNFFGENPLKLNWLFIKLIEDHPEYFYDNIKISALYGNFPGVIWNGGRFIGGEVYLSEIKNTIQVFNSIDMPLRFTFTNSLIEEKHLDDIYSNIITTYAHNGKNEILVNSQILEKYLRKNYPNFKYLSSTTKCLLNENDIINESEKYYLTVLDYRHNHNIELLKKLNPEKIEILINPYCGTSCPHRLQHYKDTSYDQLNNNLQMREYNKCCYHNNFLEALKQSEGLIKVEELYGFYSNLGYKHFKIEGRFNSIIDVLESYIYYLVKPEYKDYIRLFSLKHIFQEVYTI